MGSLTGIKVLAFEHAFAAPFGTMMLADMGADVVKVEPPGGDHVRKWTRTDLAGFSPHFLTANRNKQSIGIDLKTADGCAVARGLMAQADVIVENFSPGVADALGVGYEAAVSCRADTIYCSLSGFGGNGPYANHRAYDLMILSESGLLGVTGQHDGSLAKIGVPVADLMSGMVAAFSIVCALRDRDATGKGHRIDTSMLEVSTATMAFHLFSYGLSGTVPQPMGTAHPLLAPYETYDTADGSISIGILSEAHWKTFGDMIERTDLVQDARFASAPSRVANRAALNAQLFPLFRGRPTSAWAEMFDKNGLPYGIVNTVEGVLNHPQHAARNYFSDWNLPGTEPVSVRAPGAPWKLAGSDGADRLPPSLGQHTDAVLSAWLDKSPEELSRLRAGRSIF